MLRAPALGLDELSGDAWLGQGADAACAELSGQVLPAPNRLARAAADLKQKLYASAVGKAVEELCSRHGAELFPPGAELNARGLALLAQLQAEWKQRLNRDTGPFMQRELGGRFLGSSVNLPTQADWLAAADKTICMIQADLAALWSNPANRAAPGVKSDSAP